MNFEDLLNETTIDNIKKSIRISRFLHNSDDQTLKGLLHEYGNQFSEDELKQFIKETK